MREPLEVLQGGMRLSMTKVLNFPAGGHRDASRSEHVRLEALATLLEAYQAHEVWKSKTTKLLCDVFQQVAPSVESRLVPIDALSEIYEITLKVVTLAPNDPDVAAKRAAVAKEAMALASRIRKWLAEAEGSRS